MSDTEASVRAAREVNAVNLAPELFRQASDYYTDARRQYRLKNFEEASRLAKIARNYAEEAEFEAIKAGGERIAIPEDPLANPVSVPEQVIPPKPKDDSKNGTSSPGPSGDQKPATPPGR